MSQRIFFGVLFLALSLPAAAQTPRTVSNAYNPAVSLILMGHYASFGQDPARYALPGFALPAETGPGKEGLSLGESELVLTANVDPLFYGAMTAVLTPENEVEVEEAFFETLALGHGLTVKAGRFLSHIGYLNSQHPHVWDFADPPLAYRALLGNQYGDDGVQLRWVAPAELYIEAGGELLRGENFPAGGAARQGKGTRTAFLRTGGDVGVSHAWRAGVSFLDAKAKDRESGDPGSPDLFSGDSKLWILDFVWKWAPQGNPRERHFKLQAEYLRRTERGEFTPATSGTPSDYDSAQRGWYLQAVYQFMPRWRLGLRTDRLEADPVEGTLAGSALDAQGHKPRRTSLMVDFSASEYSRLRLQLNRDESRPETRDRQWFLQYIMSLGPHGAHPF
jgi:hypothetical protein